MTTPLRPRTQYRRYLRDASAPIPRSTLVRYQKRTRQIGLSQNTPLPDLSQSSLTLNPLDTSPASPISPPDTSPESPTSPPDTSPESPTSPPDTSPTSLPDTSPTSSPDTSPTSSPDTSPTSSLDTSPTSSPDTSPESLPSNVSQDLSEPLYQGSQITLFQALCAIMNFCTAYKLSYTAMGALLSLICLFCPTPNKVPSTFFKLKRLFEKLNPRHEHSKACLCCEHLISQCSCTGDKSPKADIVHLDIRSSLETILSNHWDSLNPSASTNGEICDVWDGSALRKQSSSGEDMLALSVSTDGVPLYKSSKVSMWPVYMVILNLPAMLRNCAKNVILAALWVDPAKPIMSLLLKPLTVYIHKLSTSGISIRSPAGIRKVTAKVVMGVFDLPAKASVLCAKQFNGEYGCSVCLHPGKRLPNNSRIYLPSTTYPDRTHETVIANAVSAVRKGTSVKGIKGISYFTSTLDLVTSVPVDYMHAVLEGVTRWLTKAWFTPTRFRKPYTLRSHEQTELDTVLLMQRPPCEFSRPPRSIKSHLSYWKASELRNWLLYYSLPLLVNFLPSLYWHHYALLVCALHILLGDRILPSQIDAAEQMLIDFCILLPDLYGDESCTANAHLLLHMTKYVRLWGPLWTHSAFCFENKNGQIKHLFHGKSQIISQLIFNIDVSHTLQRYAEPDVAGPSLNLYPIVGHTYVVGKQKNVVLSEDQARALGCSGPVLVFFRMRKNGVTFHSRQYSRALTGKRNNTYCSFLSEGCTHFGLIEVFVCSPPCALIRKISVKETSLLNTAGYPSRQSLLAYCQADLLRHYMTPVDLSITAPLQVVPLENVVGKVVFVQAFGLSCCIKQPNTIERH